MLCPGVRERHLDLDGAVGHRGNALVGPALAAHVQGDRLTSAAGLAGFAHGDLDAARLADDAVARRRKHLDAAVELVGGAGEQRVHWRVEAKRGG